VVLEIGQVNRHESETAVVERARPERAEFSLVEPQTGDQRTQLVHGLHRVAEKRHAVPHVQHFEGGPRGLQAVAGGLDGVDPHIRMDEAPAQPVGNGGGHAAAAEEVGNNRTFGGGCGNDAFKQRLGFLCCIVGAFRCL